MRSRPGERPAGPSLLLLTGVDRSGNLLPHRTCRPRDGAAPRHSAPTPPVIDGAWTTRRGRPPLPTGEWLSYNPLHGDTIPQQTTVWVGVRQRRALLRVQLRRSRSVRHQDLDHAPRQHLGRRLGRPQPRRAGHRTAVVSPDGEPERHSARHDEHVVGQRRHLARLGLAERRARHRHRLRRRDPAAAADDSLQRRAHDVRMGMLFWRRVSRIGVSVAWPALEPGKWVFETHAPADLHRHPGAC